MAMEVKIHSGLMPMDKDIIWYTPTPPHGSYTVQPKPLDHETLMASTKQGLLWWRLPKQSLSRNAFIDYKITLSNRHLLIQTTTAHSVPWCRSWCPHPKYKSIVLLGSIKWWPRRYLLVWSDSSSERRLQGIGRASDHKNSHFRYHVHLTIFKMMVLDWYYTTNNRCRSWEMPWLRRYF